MKRGPALVLCAALVALALVLSLAGCAEPPATAAAERAAQCDTDTDCYLKFCARTDACDGGY